MTLNVRSARTGAMSFTNQGLLAMGLGACMAPFTGGATLVLGACHLVSGVVYDQFQLAEKLNDQDKP